MEYISFKIDVSRILNLRILLSFSSVRWTAQGEFLVRATSAERMVSAVLPRPATGGSCSGCHNASAARIGHSSQQPPAEPTSSPTSLGATTTTSLQAS